MPIALVATDCLPNDLMSKNNPKWVWKYLGDRVDECKLNHHTQSSFKTILLLNFHIISEPFSRSNMIFLEFPSEQKSNNSLLRFWQLTYYHNEKTVKNEIKYNMKPKNNHMLCESTYSKYSIIWMINYSMKWLLSKFSCKFTMKSTYLVFCAIYLSVSKVFII